MGIFFHPEEAPFLHSVAQEVNRLAGMFCYYWSFDKVNTVKDPLYNETKSEQWVPDDTTGTKLPVFTENPSHAVSAGEEGKRTEWDAMLWIDTEDWAVNMTAEEPIIGDVVKCWDKYYEVVDIPTREGVMDDERTEYILWQLTLKRRTKFEAVRRVGA